MNNIGFEPERKNNRGRFERIKNPPNANFNMFQNNGKKKFSAKIITNIILMIVAVLLSGALLFMTLSKNKEKVDSGIYLEGINITDKTEAEIRNDIENIYKPREKEGVKFKIDNLSLNIFAKDFDMNFNTEKTLEKVREAKLSTENSNQKRLDLSLVTDYDREKYSNIYEMIIKSINKNRGIKKEVDLENLKVKITKGNKIIGIDKNEFLNQIINKYKGNEFYTVSKVNTIENINPNDNFENIYNGIIRKPVDAHLDKENNIVPEVDGVSFKLSYENALKKFNENDSAEFELKKIDAKVKKSDILNRQKKLKENQRLINSFNVSLFKKTYDISNLSYQEKYNIYLGIKNFNGYVLMPDSDFSFNNALTNITEENGYLNAPLEKDRELKVEVGGGISFISSIIYESFLSSGLKVLERSPHTYNPDFTKAGLDAMVYPSKYNLRMNNTLKNPVRIDLISYSNNNKVDIEIRGSSEDKKNITINRKISDKRKAGTTKNKSSQLEKGKEQTLRKGRDGLSVEITRIIKYSNKTEKEKINKSVYQPLKEIIEVGTNENLINLE